MFSETITGINGNEFILSYKRISYVTLGTLLKFSGVTGSDDGRRKKEAQGIKKPATLFS